MKSEQTRSERIAQFLIQYLAQVAIILVVLVVFEYLPVSGVGGFALGYISAALHTMFRMHTHLRTD